MRSMHFVFNIKITIWKIWIAKITQKNRLVEGKNTRRLSAPLSQRGSMSNFHLLLLEAEGVLPNLQSNPAWTNPDFSFLDHPDRIRKAIDQEAERLQAKPFTTEFLLFDWFPVLDKCWTVSLQRQHNLNNALFKAGYFPVGIGFNPYWHWAGRGFIRL